MKKLLFFLFFTFITFGCKVIPQLPELKQVGSRGWYTTLEPFAKFDPEHKSVDIWTPANGKIKPVIIYAHGGAGYREDDRARVAMFRRNGFATLSFDAYEMNGLDWEFVTRKVTNKGKQNLIWNVFKGAVDYASKDDRWDNQNIFFYGASNGGRIVLYAGSKILNENIKGIISEAPAATGYALGDYKVPTIIPFGKLDTWAGKSDTDYVWERTYPTSPVSIESWTKSLQEKNRPIKFIFYENAGHLLFEGPLEKVTVRRGDSIAFVAYQGASQEALQKYERDVIAFVKNHISNHNP